jgi:ATP-dependent Lon protease
LCEAFHYQFSHTNRYEDVNKRIRLGTEAEGRDEKGIKKTICAFLKILHPDGAVTAEEFDEYTHYAVELRRRVKEQMNKRKPDEEFAKINLSYIASTGKEVVVYCPESRNAMATLEPARRGIHGEKLVQANSITTMIEPSASKPRSVTTVQELQKIPVETVQPIPQPTTSDSPLNAAVQEQHFTIHYGATGYTFDSIVGPYLAGAQELIVEDPYIRITHQVHNFVRLCETIVKNGGVRKVTLITTEDDIPEIAEKTRAMLEDVSQSLLETDIVLKVRFNPNLHDREIRIDNGWTVKIGRGLDFYQKPSTYFDIGSNDLSLRKCLETKVDIFRSGSTQGK